nr:probable E3 ubiquitin-protein ligase ZFP1 [Coffea arabica]
MQQQQFYSPALHQHYHDYQTYPPRIQENMGIYDGHYVFFPPPDQTPFYPVPSAYGFPVYPQSIQPGYYSRDFFLPSPLQYYYGHPPAEAMYYDQNNNYYVNQEQNLQWPRSHLQESDQGPDLLSRFSFAPEDETVILDLDAEENYPLENQLQESDHGRNIHLRLSASFAPEDDTTPLRALDVEFVNEEGNLASVTTLIPADDPIVEFLQQLVPEDRISKNSGLLEATISEHLKIRSYQTLADQQPEICVVCQCECENGETIGTLECKHEYHADCIKRWLMKKNVCPLCKREGIQQKS